MILINKFHLSLIHGHFNFRDKEVAPLLSAKPKSESKATEMGSAKRPPFIRGFPLTSIAAGLPTKSFRNKITIILLIYDIIYITILIRLANNLHVCV